MAAKRYTLRLYRWAVMRRSREENLDPGDDVRLRELLEDLVREDQRTLNLNLAAGWRLEVWDVSGGPWYAKVTVDPSGRTVVKR